MKQNHVIVVGGGAAGLMAAAAAAEAGAHTELYAKNEKCGKKIYITGKGRCNLTNRCDRDTFLSQVCSNPRFLYSSLEKWNCEDMIRFLEENGTRTKTERGDRVFPVSDHASDVTAALLRYLERLQVKIRLNCEVKSLLIDEAGTVRGILLADGTKIAADRVIVCTGGLSYPTTGSTGDGYRFARQAGLKLIPPVPSLVPVETEGTDAQQLQGLSLRNVSVMVRDGKKVIFEEFGEMMFTHFGVSGPLILSASTKICRLLPEKKLKLVINLKPALDETQLDARFLREFTSAPNRKISNVLQEVYPARMIPIILRRCGIDPEKPARDITKAERRALVEETRSFAFDIRSLRGFNEAVITSGGVSVKEIRPDTMECRKVSGLYFAGEVLDVDARTGGFNLQIAWSTGYAAGAAAGSS